VFDTVRSGIKLNDSFGAFADAELVDNAVVRAGEYGLRATAENGMDDLVVERFTSLDSTDAAIVVGGPVSLAASALVLQSDVAFFGWDTPEVDIRDCAADGANEGPFEADCRGLDAETNAESTAGDDGIWFTDDDPWFVEGGARLP
jgi:hypothetical protein